MSSRHVNPKPPSAIVILMGGGGGGGQVKGKKVVNEEGMEDRRAWRIE